jgi:hypothetical protein
VESPGTQAPDGAPAEATHGVVLAMPVPTLVLDARGRLLAVSDSWRELLTDAEMSDALLRPGTDLLAVLDAWSAGSPAVATLAARLRAALHSDLPGSAELAVPFPSGPRSFLVAAGAVRGQAGGIVVTLTDITDRRAGRGPAQAPGAARRAHRAAQPGAAGRAAAAAPPPTRRSTTGRSSSSTSTTSSRSTTPSGTRRVTPCSWRWRAG